MPAARYHPNTYIPEGDECDHTPNLNYCSNLKFKAQTIMVKRLFAFACSLKTKRRSCRHPVDDSIQVMLKNICYSRRSENISLRTQ